jgi:hypothetical protein
MKSRGCHVSAGDRLPYIVLEKEILSKRKVKISEQLEDLEYYKENSSVLKIDSLYYLRLSINSMDEIFLVGYNQTDILKKIFKYRENYYKVIKELQKLFTPRNLFQDQEFVFLDE